MYALLDALHRQQLEQYEEQEIYELDYHNPVVRDSEVLLINLGAEILALTAPLIWRWHAMPVLSLWCSGILKMQFLFPAAVTGRDHTASYL